MLNNIKAGFGLAVGTMLGFLTVGLLTKELKIDISKKADVKAD